MRVTFGEATGPLTQKLYMAMGRNTVSGVIRLSMGTRAPGDLVLKTTKKARKMAGEVSKEVVELLHKWGHGKGSSKVTDSEVAVVDGMVVAQTSFEVKHKGGFGGEKSEHDRVAKKLAAEFDSRFGKIDAYGIG